MPILNMVWWWKKWGNIWEPLNLTVTTSWLDATITWEDNEIWTIPPTTFQKSELVRKIGSAPTSPSDWDLVVTETVKDSYKTTWYVDQWLTGWETYYYRVFSYSDLGGISYCDAVSVTPSAGWWQPWANTIAYYEFNNNLNDSSGNSHDMTMRTWSFTYWTENSWAKYVYMPRDAWTNYWTYSLSYNDTTLSFWRKWTANSSSASVFLEIWYNPYLYARLSQNVHVEANRFDGWTYAAWTTRHYYTIVYENGTMYIYMDGVLVNSWVPQWDLDTTRNVRFVLNQIWDTNSQNYTNEWYLSELIWESKAWTAQEISDYFNQTKANYWIS
jgi:hypothetical protein